MGLMQDLNRSGMTMVLVTHERHIGAFAKRAIAFRDGHIVDDGRNAQPADARASLREQQETTEAVI